MAAIVLTSVCVFFARLIHMSTGELEVMISPPDEVFETNAAVIVCMVKDLGTQQRVAWFKDGIEVHDNDIYSISEAKNNRKNQVSYDLDIKIVHRNDKDSEFACRVINAGNGEYRTSEIVHLNIKNVPLWYYPWFYPKCLNLVQGLQVGEMYTVRCSTEETDPPVGLVLRKNNHVICNSTSTGKTSCTHDASAQLEDMNAEFTCDQIPPTHIAKYPKDVARSCRIGTLTILQAPRVEIKGDFITSKGEEVVLICNFNVDASAGVVKCLWEVDNDDGIKTKQEQALGGLCILRLQTTSEVNSLRVTCNATNSIGTGSSVKMIRFTERLTTQEQGLSGHAQDLEAGVSDTKGPLWTGVIIAITGCFAIVIVLITSVILYCGWRHLFPLYSQAGLPNTDLYSEQYYNGSHYRMQGIQRCVAVQVSADDVDNECIIDLEKKISTDSEEQNEEHYAHVCSS